MESPIKIGVSWCLLGERVRYDGGHKLDRYLVDTLGKFVQYVPVCPEVGCGLPVPRESMHLAGDPSSPSLITSRTHIDHTEKMLKWAAKRVAELEKEDLCGFIFKSNSPSSGMERVKVYLDTGIPVKTGVGIFARAFMDNFPYLPVEDEGRLHDPGIRENFIERVFAFRRLKDFLAGKADMGGLVGFHTVHKFQIMAHSPQLYREMGKLVAAGKGMDRQHLLDRYRELFMRALALHATAKKNTDVLMHIMGYFRNELTKGEKAELLEVIRQYHDRMIPLVVPLTLLRHYVGKYDQPYLKKQIYLNPHPMELMLRNHV